MVPVLEVAKSVAEFRTQNTNFGCNGVPQFVDKRFVTHTIFVHCPELWFQMGTVMRFVSRESITPLLCYKRPLIRSY